MDGLAKRLEDTTKDLMPTEEKQKEVEVKNDALPSWKEKVAPVTEEFNPMTDDEFKTQCKRMANTLLGEAKDLATNKDYKPATRIKALEGIVRWAGYDKTQENGNGSNFQINIDLSDANKKL